MVVLIYVKCHRCKDDIPRVSKETWKPWCLLCEGLIPYLEFCDKCTGKIYDHENHQIKKKFQEGFNISCQICEQSTIGFDYSSKN